MSRAKKVLAECPSWPLSARDVPAAELAALREAGLALVYVGCEVRRPRSSRGELSLSLSLSREVDYVLTGRAEWRALSLSLAMVAVSRRIQESECLSLPHKPRSTTHNPHVRE